MSSLGAESTRPILCLLCSPPSLPTHVSSSSVPPNRGLERALEEASSSGVLNLSSRKLKEFPQTAANHDLSDTVEAGRGSGDRGQAHITQMFCREWLWNRKQQRPERFLSQHTVHLTHRTGSVSTQRMGLLSLQWNSCCATTVNPEESRHPANVALFSSNKTIVSVFSFQG